MLALLQHYLKDNWLLAISAPFYTGMILLEVIVSNYHKKAFYTVKETLINFWLNMANTLLGISCKVLVLGMMSWFLQFHLISISNEYLYWMLLFSDLTFAFMSSIAVSTWFVFYGRCT